MAPSKKAAFSAACPALVLLVILGGIIVGPPACSPVPAGWRCMRVHACLAGAGYRL